MHIPSHLQADYLRDVVPAQKMICIPRWVHQVVEERVLPLSAYCDLDTLSQYISDADLIDYLLNFPQDYFKQHYDFEVGRCTRYRHPSITFMTPFSLEQSMKLLQRSQTSEEMVRARHSNEEKEFDQMMIGRPLQPGEEIVWRVVDLGQRPADPSSVSEGVIDVIGLIAHFVTDVRELSSNSVLRFDFHRSLIHCLYNHRVPLEVLADHGLLAGWISQFPADRIQHISPTE